jgi:predicted nucleic acid-binding protein
LIVADTGAIVALIDADDRHHERLRAAFEAEPDRWILPWAILPEVDYLLLHHVGLEAELTFLRDVAEGRWTVEWGTEADLARASELCAKHRGMRIGMVDGVVASVAERLRADAVATLDERHFGTLVVKGDMKLLPRDL